MTSLYCTGPCTATDTLNAPLTFYLVTCLTLLFRYVEFVDPAHAAAALEAKNGAQIDGREVRLDFSTGRQNQKAGNNMTPQQRSSDRAQRYGDTPKEPSTTLFVGNISFEATQDMVYEAFAEFGTIQGVRLPTDRETGAPKG